MRKKNRRVMPQGWTSSYHEARDCGRLREGHAALHDALHEFSDHLELVFDSWVPVAARPHLAGLFVRLLDEIDATEKRLMIEHERRAHGYVPADVEIGPLDLSSRSMDG